MALERCVDASVAQYLMTCASMQMESGSTIYPLGPRFGENDTDERPDNSMIDLREFAELCCQAVGGSWMVGAHIMAGMVAKSAHRRGWKYTHPKAAYALNSRRGLRGSAGEDAIKLLLESLPWKGQWELRGQRHKTWEVDSIRELAQNVVSFCTPW